MPIVLKGAIFVHATTRYATTRFDSLRPCLANPQIAEHCRKLGRQAVLWPFWSVKVLTLPDVVVVNSSWMLLSIVPVREGVG